MMRIFSVVLKHRLTSLAVLSRPAEDRMLLPFRRLCELKVDPIER